MAKIKKPRSAPEIIKFFSYGIFTVFLGFAITYQFVQPAPPTRLVLAAGSRGGAYLAFAKEYQQLLAKDGIRLDILETSGSLENLSLLAAGKADAAIMQNGIARAEQYPELLGLGSLYFEPLWFFIRKDVSLSRLEQLKGKRVVVGARGSGTRKVVLQLLGDNDIGPESFVDVDLSGLDAVEALKRGDVDALFMISAVSSPVVDTMLHSDNLLLVNFSRAEAYARRYRFLSHLLLPQGVVDLAENIPAHDVNLVAPAATMVVNRSLHPALAGLLTEIIDRVHGRGSLLNTSRHQFPSPEYLDFPLSDDAARFYRRGIPFLQRYLPFWMAIQLDRLKLMLLPMLAMLIPLIKILPLTYRWRMRSRIYRWYDTLQVLDYEVRQKHSRQAVAQFIARLNEIENEVRQISVPLPYASELYLLRQHIDLLRRQVKEIDVDEGEDGSQTV
ncbi:MAG: C4-dicarboxylate ABC transporter substrate-binding protein [Deltaproteobacteria bacterium]|nr:MAG: C4-dicarboxylate ABC transporter substrate-binding protein [Deltaproteobacteria bacterium]